MLMRTAWIVFLKECLDNLRDRRTLASALLMGPLLGPLMFGGMISISLDRAVEQTQSTLEIATQGGHQAPNLVAWLAQHNITTVPVEGDPRELVRSGERELVLVVSEDYARRLREGMPATLTLVADSADSAASRHVARVQSAVGTYRKSLVQRRLMVRGVSPLVLVPVNLQSDDVATPTGRSVAMLGMVTYFLIFATLFGGMYLAIDTTAGERERKSLEPLLSLPVPRSGLVIGKLAATSVFAVVSLTVSLIAFSLAVPLIPLDQVGMVADFGPRVVAGLLLVMLPFALFGASLLTLVASFTRTYREAQTYVSLMMLVPTFPIVFAFIYGVRPTALLTAVPSLGQHLLMTELIKGEALNFALLGISWASTLALAGVLAWVAYRFYQRESIVG
ncbi:MAG: ABC transporter permease [Pseudomonadota bacterium]